MWPDLEAQELKGFCAQRLMMVVAFLDPGLGLGVKAGVECSFPWPCFQSQVRVRVLFPWAWSEGQVRVRGSDCFLLASLPYTPLLLFSINKQLGIGKEAELYLNYFLLIGGTKDLGQA